MPSTFRRVALVAVICIGLAGAYTYRILSFAASTDRASDGVAAKVVADRSPRIDGGNARVSPFGLGAPVAQGAQKEEADSVSAVVLRNFNSDKSTTERVDFAKRHMKEGGSFYAARMLVQCSIVRGTPAFEEGPDVLAKGDPDYARRVAASNLLRRQCGGMAPSETSDESQEDLMRQGRREGDPLLLASERLRRVPNRFRDDEVTVAARRAATAQLLSTRDPLLIDEAGMSLLLYVDARTAKKYFWFEGQSYGLDSEHEVGAALYLLPCGLGLRCDSSDFKIALSCASGDVCDASRFDQLRRMFASRPGVYERVEQLYNRMLIAVQTGNTASFSR